MKVVHKPSRSSGLIQAAKLVQKSNSRTVNRMPLARLLLSRYLLVMGLVSVLVGELPAQENPQAKAQREGDRILVEFDGQPFTEYHLSGYPKPILYPIIGPHGVEMTRHYPMKKDVGGEAFDHPHHQSVWFAHGDVNGIDFWTIGEGKGKIEHEKLLGFSSEKNEVKIDTENRWVQPDGSTVCTDTTRLGIRAEGDARLIDYQITIHAGEKDVVFGDTKEGTMALRTHPELRLRGKVAKGHGRNSEGDEDRSMWGKRAKWVDYWGPINDHTVGIAILDHPSNPRHPTWWHARDYGLVAANPFGQHDFEKKPTGVGDLTIPAGESKTFRYLLIFHSGDWKQAKIAEQFKKFAASKPDAIAK